MADFNKHFKMNEAEVIEYSKEKGLWKSDAQLTCQEIGDGNINYVFRVSCPAIKKSIIIKQAGIFLRSSGRRLSVDRNRIEAEVLMLYSKLAPGFLPEIYFYDPVMCCIVMQDLIEYENMRYALLEHKIFSTFVEDITTFMANVFIRTTDNILDPVEKKKLMRRYINPELCQISEKLVFTEPYTNYYGTNLPFQENKDFFAKELYGDKQLLLEAAKLKERFKSTAQALIHGDLHTGSIFVKEGSTMILDPEFAFYGPIGYDIGNIIANLIFSWINTEVTMEGDTKSTFQNWLENTIKLTVDLFYQKSLKILKEESTEPLAKAIGFAEWYLQDVLCDVAGMTGLELSRRIIGDTKVQDIAGIKESKQRKIAERICVLCAKEFILKRNVKYQKGKDYIDTMYEIKKIISF